VKKFFLLLFVLAAVGVATILYLKPSDESIATTTGDEGETARMISTAPEADEPAAEAEAPAEPAEETAEAEGDSDAATALQAKLLKALGEMPDSAIKPAPVEGWYEVARGSAIGYISEDARYLFDGDLIDLQNKVNLTEKRRNDWRKTKIASIDEDQMIIFEPKKATHTVTVFTDVDCGYCRKLHSQIDEYLAEGIRVRYVFYPLRGEKAPSYHTAENVWCADDRQQALTLAKQGKKVEEKQCETPVAQHLQTGIELGIRGTPGIISEDGRLLPGYMPPKTLLSELDKGSQG